MSSPTRRGARRSPSRRPRKSWPRRDGRAGGQCAGARRRPRPYEADYYERYQRLDKLEVTAGTEIEWPAPYWYVDAGAAAMVLMLAAIDEGLATAIFGVTDVPRAETDARRSRRRISSP